MNAFHVRMKPLLRFWPAVVGGWFFSVFAVSSLVSMIASEGHPMTSVQMMLISAWVASAFFVLFSVTVILFIERMQPRFDFFERFSSWIVLLFAGLVFLFEYVALVHEAPGSVVFRSFLLVVVSFFSIAFLPFIVRPLTNSAYWNWLLKTVKQFLFSFFTTGAFFLGLLILFVSLDALFGIRFVEDYPIYLFFLVLGCVSLPVFLYGIPSVKQETNEMSAVWLRGLSVFTQWVVLPLILIYFVVLYAYGAKIVWVQEWPQGVTGTLALGFLSLGWIAYHLSFPFWSSEKQPSFYYWFQRLFWVGVLPAIALLLVSLVIRIQGFGFTPVRTCILMIGIWFFTNAIAFLSRRTISFVVMPSILLLVLFLFILSPWSL
jgi:hypothetical protein